MASLAFVALSRRVLPLADERGQIRAQNGVKWAQSSPFKECLLSVADEDGNCEKRRRIVVYPCYIDASLTRAKGRRINVSKACKMPFVDDLYHACITNGVGDVTPERRSNPREPHLYRGRVLLTLPEGVSKQQFLVTIASWVNALEHPHYEKIHLERERMLAMQQQAAQKPAKSKKKK